ncbi:IS3 family transposase [Mycobacterium ulcerans]|uniref:Integrase catalytic subunit n=1 Tax=Mycobacterium ulcerans subsp. shinshuense TaxID=1124626 RepID=A0A1B4YA73_MYCUL|nr:IS3 family transposase [Mycobacterium ulcerans]BAV43952.1 integrase catalytic subunit [Mycobacterium ulcerans subsp. shinshuense]
MSVARFIADQRTKHQVPHAVSCAILGVSESWFYKWVCRQPTPTEIRRGELDAAVEAAFGASGCTYGSPRVHADLVEAGWTVSVNTVADSMRRQGLQGRKPKRRRSLTRQDKAAPKFADLLRRDFSATAPNLRWCGDMTEIVTDEGKLYLATVLDLFSRKLLASPTSEHPDARLACDAIKMATAVRGGRAVIDGVIFHTDRGSTYTATDFTKLCRRIGVVQSMGRVGSCFDNAASEAFFSTLEHEVLSRHHFRTRDQARAVVVPWCQDFYNGRRRHSSAALLAPDEYERIAAIQPDAA